ncbi:MAG: alpha-L-fucosidase [Bryobacterales bacterium]|nr:alpha-L-fucosidase [Bryobacterales bacterium]
MALSGLAQARFEPSWDSIGKRKTPEWFLDAKFGIFIHWGPYAVPAYAPVGEYAEWYWRHLERGPVHQGKPNHTYEFHQRNYGKDFPYANFAPLFRAEMYEPHQWAELFRKAGAKYVVLTSKHHDGFALWPSKHADAAWGRPWNAVAVGAKRDLLGDLTDAVRAKGLRMGYYYSLYEWYNPLWEQDRNRYAVEHMHPQFKDLVTRYKPSVIFSDGEWDMPSEDWKSPELLAWLYNESPVGSDVVVNDRWGKESRHKHGDYFTTEYAAGMDSDAHAWEENRGMGFSYGYNRAENLSDYRTGREFIVMLVDLVSRGGNLLLNVGPTADGRIPAIMQQRLTEIGEWLEPNGEAIYGTRTWKTTRQWSTGTVPKLETGEYKVKYDVLDFTDRPKPGEARIEAFFTRKGNHLYAILPRWESGEFVLKQMRVAPETKITLLGAGGGQLPWRAKGGDVVVRMPDYPAQTSAPSARQQAWVLKLEGALRN